MSAIMASSQPPPKAKPETAAIKGVFRVVIVEDQLAIKLVFRAVENVRFDISLMSAPADGIISVSLL